MTTSAADESLKRLAEAGFDVSAGVENAAQDPALYLRLLALFAKTRAGYPASLAEASVAGAAALARLVHSCKGECRTLGLHDIAATSEALEASLSRSEELPHAMVAALAEQVRQTVETIRGVLSD